MFMTFNLTSSNQGPSLSLGIFSIGLSSASENNDYAVFNLKSYESKNYHE